mmetsp:Transcript_1299/g.5181  ORF Transcript_1299/g.5181 Transcript_1299/m.5181 type:complete len:207 (+) Transcript_1299:924-1544(+)
MFPGKGEKPVSSLTSPSGNPDALSIGSSWLYSTLMVSAEPSSRTRRVMAPTASLAVRGTAMLLKVYPSRMDTPIAATDTVKHRELVSWKKTMCERPSSAHLRARPVVSSIACTSPWPCGLVCTLKASSSSGAMCPSLSKMAATFSCLISVIWPSAAPKLALSARSFSVASWVSPLVMMASGTTSLVPCLALAARWRARICSTYSCR